MSRLPAFFYALARKVDAAPPPERGEDTRAVGESGEGTPAPSADARRDDDGGNLAVPAKMPESAPQESTDDPRDSRNVRPLGIMDLSRLSIDNDGRLYWDGKPVEVRRRITMSRAQVIGASVIGAFIVIGAVGAAVHGVLAARDLACRFGWTTTYCTLPQTAPPARPRDIPA